MARAKREGHHEQLRVVEETFAAFSSIKWGTFVKKRRHLFWLPAEVLAAVRAGRITSAQADLVSRLKDNAKSPDAVRKMRENLIEQLERGMSLEELGQAVKGVQKKPEVLQAPEVQAANRVKKALMAKRILKLPPESRKRVQELLEEVSRLMDDKGASA